MARLLKVLGLCVWRGWPRWLKTIAGVLFLSGLTRFLRLPGCRVFDLMGQRAKS
jgi:hypothetical protein